LSRALATAIYWINLDFIFKIKVLIFSDKLNSPQNSTEKSGVQILEPEHASDANCDARRGGSRAGLARIDLVYTHVHHRRFLYSGIRRGFPSKAGG
jgi:hypothetical protein